jgi:hypothetical protein
MNRVWFDRTGISCVAVNEFFQNQKDAGNEIHSIMVYKNDRLVMEAQQCPYSLDDKRELYSLSKTFTSTSIGIACDEGLLSVDERIVDIFPRQMP